MKRKLLSVLLTFCLAFSLLPTAALADSEGTQTNDVAQIGSTKYASLTEAIEAAEGGATITLLADVNTSDTSYYIDKRLTIDLNGKTVTGSGYDGVFSITGAGAEVCIKNGTVVAVEKNGDAGKYTMAVWAHAAGCTVTLEALTVSQQINHTDDKQMDMIYASAGTIIINSGSFTSGTPKWTLNCLDKAYKERTANIIVNGGTFFDYDPRNAKNEGEGTSLVADGVGINKNENGSFTAVPNMAAQIVDADGNSVAAYAGQYEAIAAAKDGETVILLNDRKNFVTNTINANITIDLNGKTLSLGNNNPFFRTNGEVTIQNGTIESNYACAIVNAYNKLTLKNVKITGVTGDNGKNLVNVCSNAEVTIDKDTVLTASGSGVAVFVGVKDAADSATFKLNVYGKVIQNSKTYAISGNGSYKGTTTINIYEGAEVKSPDCVAMYQPQAGVTNIYGGLVEGKCAIGIKSGALNISGGTVRGTLNDHVLSDEDSLPDGMRYDGSAIIVDSRATGYAGNVKINITGGTVESYYSNAIREIGNDSSMTQLTELTVTGGNVFGASQKTENVENDMKVRDISVSNVSVSGGTFNHEVQSRYCADKFVPVNNNDGTYGVKVDDTVYVAKLLDAQGAYVNAYGTLAEAINAAGNGDTVTLLKDVTENVTIPADKTITLDLNGFTLVNSATAQTNTAADRKHTITNNGTLTIKDSVGGGIVDNVSHGCAAIKNNVGGTVTIENGTFCRTAEASTGADNSGGNSYYVIDNQGTMNINGGTFKFSDTKDGAYSSLIHNGWQDGTKNTGKTPAKMTITDGNFTQGTGGKITVKNDDYGELKIQGGTFTQPQEGYYCVLNWNVAEITGGTINGPVGCGGNELLEGDKGKLTIGGTARIDGELQKNTSYGEPSISVSGGNFSQSVDKNYLDSSLNAELKRASGKTPYSYYTSMDDALAAAKPGDTVTDLNAATDSKVTLTLKYNDGATADSTYNVASGTTITLPTPKRSGYTFNGWYDGSTKVSSPYEVTKNVTLTASWSYNYSGGSSSYDPTYSVSTPSKTENGSVTVSPKNASKGDTVTVTVKPDSGYVLETLTVTDKNGNELTLKDKGNGKYTFTMPAGKVEVKATFMEDNSMLNFFYDVPNNAYFYEAVKWAVKNGITTGVGNDLFAPEQPCTRAQIVTFLWRAAGSPEPKGAASGMSDVVSGSYYEKAVAWAIENGITTGTTTSTFSPDATCTRAQAVTFLARALKAKAASAAEFSDVPNDSYFADAVAWAAANGVTEGIGGGLFGSDNDCTRGQIVTFLYRAYNK